MAVDDRRPGTSPVGARSHRVHWFAGRALEVLDDLTGTGDGVGLGASVATLGPAETAEVIGELTGLLNRVEGLRLRVLAHADRIEVADEDGATSTGAWLAHRARMPHRTAHGLVRLARSLDRDHPATATALTTGAIDSDQAREVVAAVEALPARVEEPDRARAEQHLLVEAACHDARKLKLLGKRLLEVIDPDAAEAELARQVEAEERTAAQKVFLKLFDDGHGTCHGTFRITTLHGAMLTKALHALTSPARPDPIPREETDQEGEVVPRLPAAVLGEAFGQYLERFPTKKLPTAGGLDVTVVVTVALDQLLEGLGVASLDTGGHLSIGQARRLACQAGIIPAVMGGKSELLDLGRRRLFNRPQRIALSLRDKGCTVASCDRPPAWCHAHHHVPWSRGGTTTLANGRLLCPRHHTLTHHPDYTTTDAGNGLIHLTRRRRQ